jgi:tetratricopeptide (TPR) repeat protein
MRRTNRIGLLLATLAAPASAAVTVFGGGTEAHQCYEWARQGRFDDEAIHICSIALSRPDLTDYDRGGTYINRGVMYLRRLDLGPAQADLDAGVALNPTVGEGWMDRGAVYIAQKHWRVGIVYINRAIELGVIEPEKAYYNRARAEEELDDEKAAYFDYLKAAELKPGWDLPLKELERFKVTRK